MNNIRKNAIFTIVILFAVYFNSIPVSAQQSPDTTNVTSGVPSQSFENFTRLNLIVSDLKFKNNSFKYQVGSKIEGNFKIVNITSYYASGLYYQINLHKSSQDMDSSPIFGLDRSTIYDFARSEAFSVVPGEEQNIAFSYSIPENFPAGDLYYLEISVHTSKEEFLGNVQQKISIVNDQQPHFVFLDPKTSLIFGKERAYSIYEGPTFDYDKEYHPVKDNKNTSFDFMNPDQKYEPSEETLKNLIRVKLSFNNSGEEIKKPKLKMTTYRYGFPFNKPTETSIEYIDIGKNYSGDVGLLIPMSKEAGAYETFIQLYDNDKKVSNSLEIVNITSGDSGLIYSFLVEKKGDRNYVFRIMATPPADNMQSNAIAQDYVEKVSLKAKGKNTGKVCWEEEKEVNLKNSRILEIPFEADCQEPMVFSAELEKDGKLLDSQSISAESEETLKSEKQDSAKEAFRKKIMNFGLLIVGVAFLILAIWWLLRKRNNNSQDSNKNILTVLLFSLIAAGLGFSKQSSAFGSPSLLSPANGTVVSTSGVTFKWTRPSGFTPTGIGGNHYQLVFTNGGSFTATSESLAVAASDIPMGSSSWYVKAIEGYTRTNTYCQYTTSEYGNYQIATSYGNCNYLDNYGSNCCSVQLSYDWWATGGIISESSFVVTGTTTSNSFSIIRDKPAVATHPNHRWTPYPDLNNFSGVNAIKGDIYGTYTMRFINNPFDTSPDIFTFTWSSSSSNGASLYYNIFDRSGISYNGTDNFLIEEGRTTFPLYAYAYLYGGGCPNGGKGSYINFYIVDQSGNFVKNYSFPGYWYSYFQTVAGDQQRYLQLPINDLDLDTQYYLVIHQNYYELNRGETHFVYIPFIRGGVPTLNVTKSGTGVGTVSSADRKINCGNTCSANYTRGANTAVSLTATPADSNSTFTGWSGSCSGIGTCNLIMNSAKSVTASFNCACNDSGSHCTGTTYVNSCGMTCSGTMPQVSGRCGNAAEKIWGTKPNSNLCFIGTASNPTSSSENQWCWTCSGICGGNTAECCAQRDNNWKEVAP